MAEISKTHQELLDSIPELEAYQKSLEEFLELDLRRSSDQQIKTAYDKHLRFVPYPLMFISKEEFNSKIFYRVRNLPFSYMSEDISSIRTFSYPPIGSCKSNGRANKRNTSIFYCSEFVSTAMMESKQNADQMGFLSIWTPLVDRDVLIACFLSKKIKSDNPMYEEANSLYEFLDEQAAAMGLHKKKQLNLLIDFLFDRFIHEQFPYPLTSWISHQMMYMQISEKPPTDGIVYPSVESSLHFCNYAFGTQFTDDFLKLDKVIQFKLEDVVNGKGYFHMGQIGDVQKERIVWRKPSEEEFKEFDQLIHTGLR
jgi:RES domain